MTSCLRRVSKATSPATASASEPPQSQLGTVFQIIKFKPWRDGPAQLIYRTFTLQRSRYLSCLSSFRSQLLVNSRDQIHRDLFCFSGLAHFISKSASLVSTSCRRACRPTPGQCFYRDLLHWHDRWLPWTFLVGACLDLVCQAEQHRIC